VLPDVSDVPDGVVGARAPPSGRRRPGAAAARGGTRPGAKRLRADGGPVDYGSWPRISPPGKSPGPVLGGSTPSLVWTLT
jgi:hypothetical protein